MTQFSASLGLLWAQLPLAEAIMQAKKIGFDAVECHWPYDDNQDDIADALRQTGLKMLGINTRRGNIEAGEFGLSALVGREAEARLAIDEAVDFAAAMQVPNIHLMAGIASGADAYACFIDNIRYATDKARHYNLTILIEPINHYDVPHYFLHHTQQAIDIINHIGADNLKLMFDCYHIQRMQGNITHHLQQCKDYIGHIQFASVPERAEPDRGELDYRTIFQYIAQKLDYHKPLGAEYRPSKNGDNNNDMAVDFAWLTSLK